MCDVCDYRGGIPTVVRLQADIQSEIEIAPDLSKVMNTESWYPLWDSIFFFFSCELESPPQFL